MMDSETKHIHIADYNYPLPSERIAKYPLKERDQSKLLLYRQGEVGEDVFANLRLPAEGVAARLQQHAGHPGAHPLPQGDGRAHRGLPHGAGSAHRL